MERNNSPTKRRRSEFHDPDYPLEAENAEAASSSKRRREETGTEKPNRENLQINKIQKVRGIISREFDIEINNRKQQLETIEERLSQAHNLLDRLRYAIVAQYYQKQEIPLTKIDADKIRGGNTLFDKEKAGPQMPIHPAIKKIIGKRPTNNHQFLNRACRERTAALNARQTIRARSATQRREERRIQQQIRSQGIVIDHSKEHKKSEVPIKIEKPILSTPHDAKSGGKALNSSRLNNKEKHLIVVGNTSQYIGGENDNNHETKPNDLPIAYKWLVYIQCKDKNKKIEKYVKKVRFYLHHSYRPNDIVDVCAKPFQIARRGWGEFPIRIQLFFHESLQQKPIQLVHNLVLDKTLSGLHTLGAETLVEIWLRTLKSKQNTDTAEVSAVLNQATPYEVSDSKNKVLPIENNNTYPSKIRTISITNNKDLQDNLFEFINKFEETPTSLSADIEKIRPTVVVNEQLACKVKLEESPQKQKTILYPPQTTQNMTTSQSPQTVKPTTSTPTPTTTTTIIQSNPKTFIIPKTCASPSPTTNTNTNLTTIPAFQNTSFNIVNSPSNSKPKIIRLIPPQGNKQSGVLLISNKSQNPINLNKCSNVPASTSTASFVNSSAITNGNSTNTTSSAIQDISKKFLQKKLVQLVDSEGKIKYIQMLVATNTFQKPTITTTSTVTKPNTAAATITTQPKIMTITTSSSVYTSTQNAKPITTNSPTSDGVMVGSTSITLKRNNNVPLNVTSTVQTAVSTSSIATKSTSKIVYQKEGKLYIIDPLKIKLKQEQPKQVSLLKPQVSLLKQQQPKQQQMSLPQVQMPVKPLHNEVSVVTCDHDYTPTTGTTVTSTSQRQQIVRLARLNAYKAQQEQRYKFEKQFLLTKFETMRTAVEYLLRRIPIVGPNNLPSMGFPFVCGTEQAFQKLTATKQRAFDWLRAKYISRLIRHHQQLKLLDANNKESFWSTREIAKFARHHGWTPILKPFLHNATVDAGTETKPFAAIVKTELKHEPQLQYDTLTAHGHIAKWVENMHERLQQYEVAQLDSEIIDIDSVENAETANNKKPAATNTPVGQTLQQNQNKIFVRPPTALENYLQITTEICREFGVRLEPEEIDTDLICPTTQIIFSKCLRIFVEKLLRHALATKICNDATFATPHTSTKTDSSANVDVITPQDIGKVITQSIEFDFLSNCHFGVEKIADT